MPEVIGRKPSEFLHGPQTEQSVVAHMRSQIERQEGFKVEVVNYTKAGKKYWVHVDVEPVKTRRGRVRHFIAVETQRPAAAEPAPLLEFDRAVPDRDQLALHA